MKKRKELLDTRKQAELNKQLEEERLLNIGKKKNVQFKATEPEHTCCVSIDVEAIQTSIESGFFEIPTGSSSEDIHKLLMS